MNRYLKWIAWMLAFMMLFSSAYIPSYAEDAAAELPTVEELALEMTPASEEKTVFAPEEEATAEPEEELALVPEEEATAEPEEEPALVPEEEATSVPEDEPTQAPEEEPTPELEDEPTQAPEEESTPEPVDEPAQTPEEEPESVPENEPAQTPEEEPESVPENEPTQAPEEEPTPEPEDEPTQAPEEEPTPEPVDEPTQAPVDEPTPEPEEAPPAPFEQREVIGSTVVTVSAPSGVMLPDSYLTIYETGHEVFVQSVLAASQAEGDVIRHRMISFSGAQINGTALVTINEPLISELESQYPGAEIQVYVYAFQPDAVLLEDLAHRVSASVYQDYVSFYMTDLTVYDVMIVVKLPVPEPAAEPSPEPAEETEAPETETTAEETEVPETEAPAEQSEAPETEAPAEETEAPETEAPTEEPEAETEPEAFTVTITASYEGKLRYGSTVTLTAVFSVDIPDAVITWEYSPDGGITVFTAEGEQGSTLTYTYTEENQNYCWRAVVRRASAE